jgi:hypothetical protein
VILNISCKVELADRALLDLHYLQLKLRGHPPLDMKKLLAVAIIARDLERVMFEEVRRGEQLGHEGTESVEGTEDFSEDLARKQSLSAKLETAGDAINRVRMLVATLHTVVRRVRMHTAGALTKELRNTRKQLELFLDQNRLARPKSSLPHESGGGAANKLDATRRALTASLDQISQAAGIVFQWVASHDNDANAASFVECLRSLGNKLRALCPTSDRRRRAPAAPAIAAPSAVPLVSTRAGANEEDDDDDDDDDDGIGGDIDDDDDDDDDDEELAVMGAHAGKAGAAVSTLVMGGTIRTVSSMPELLDDLEVHVNNTGSDEPSQSSSTQAEFIDAASRTEAN